MRKNWVKSIMLSLQGGSQGTSGDLLQPYSEKCQKIIILYMTFYRP